MAFLRGLLQIQSDFVSLILCSTLVAEMTSKIRPLLIELNIMIVTVYFYFIKYKLCRKTYKIKVIIFMFSIF
jgi:hypothetical protein